MPTNWSTLFNIFDPWGVLSTDHELNSYYVERENSPLLRLITDFSLSNQHEKALLVGHIGSGKTSSLAMLRKTLEDKFFIVQLDAQTELSVFNTGHAEVLILIGLGAYFSSKKRGIKVSPKKYVALVNSLRTIIDEQENSSGAGLGTEQVLSQISGWIKVGFSNSLKKKLEIGPVIPEIINRVNEILEDIEQKTNKPVLVTIDGLDKLDVSVAQDVFAQSTLLNKPTCHIVYTIPISLRYETTFSHAINYFRTYDLPNFKVNKRNGTPCPSGCDRLANVIRFRIKDHVSEKQLVITDDAINLLVQKSGGLLRDLIRLTQTSCREAMVAKVDYIDKKHAEKAVQELANEQSKGLGDIHWQELAKVHETKKITTTLAKLSVAGEIKEVAVCNQLLSGRHIFSYSDEAGTWFDVHPILLANIAKI